MLFTLKSGVMLWRCCGREGAIMTDTPNLPEAEAAVGALLRSAIVKVKPEADQTYFGRSLAGIGIDI